MEWIIVIALMILAAIVMMVIMTMVYHFFSAIVPFLAACALAIGILVGFCSSVKNAFLTLKEVYGKKKV